MCNDAVWVDPLHLKYVPDHFKKQEMCDKAVRDEPRTLLFVPDCFVTRQWLYMWYDDGEYCDDDDDDDDDDKDNFLSGMMVIKNERLKKPE